MKWVYVQFLPSEHGYGCLSSVDLDSACWDTVAYLKGSICIWPDMAHNVANNPDVQRLITAWAAAGVSWVTPDEALAQGYSVKPPYSYFPKSAEPFALLPDGQDPLDPLTRYQPQPRPGLGRSILRAILQSAWGRRIRLQTPSPTTP